MTRYFSLLETKLHRWVPVLLILGGVLGNVFTAEAGITDTTGITDTSNRNPESVDVPITLSYDRMIVSLEIEGGRENNILFLIPPQVDSFFLPAFVNSWPLILPVCTGIRLKGQAGSGF